jgi:hypothetical protein
MDGTSAFKMGRVDANEAALKYFHARFATAKFTSGFLNLRNHERHETFAADRMDDAGARSTSSAAAQHEC